MYFQIGVMLILIFIGGLVAVTAKFTPSIGKLDDDEIITALDIKLMELILHHGQEIN